MYPPDVFNFPLQHAVIFPLSIPNVFPANVADSQDFMKSPLKLYCSTLQKD